MNQNSNEKEYTAPVQRNTAPKRAVTHLCFNHPKNYFGVPLAIAAEGDTGVIIKNNIVSMAGRARDGAEALGLIDHDANLTQLGEELIHQVKNNSAISQDIQTFAALKGSSTRFIETAPSHWKTLSAKIITQYEPTRQLINLLQKTGPVTLQELASFLTNHDHDLKDTIIAPSSDISASVEPKTPATSVLPQLANPDHYLGQSTYQFKTLLFHTGVLTHRGADTSALIPDEDLWALEPKFRPQNGGEL